MKSTTTSERDSLSLDVLASTYASNRGDVARYALEKLAGVYDLLSGWVGDVANPDRVRRQPYAGEVRIAMREISDVMEALR